MESLPLPMMQRTSIGAAIGACRRTRSFQLSSTIAPPLGSLLMACLDDWLQARARMRTEAFSFRPSVTAAARTSTTPARTEATGPLRRIRAAPAARGTSTSIRATSVGAATTTATTGGLFVLCKDLPNSARIACVFDSFNSLILGWATTRTYPTLSRLRRSLRSGDTFPVPHSHPC